MKNRKINKSLIVVMIMSIICLICAIGYIIYNLCFNKDSINYVQNICNSLIIFVFIITFTISTLIYKEKIKNILCTITALLISIFIIFNFLINVEIINLPKQNTIMNFYNTNINDAVTWGKKNNIAINQLYEYSDVIPEFYIISQDIAPNTLQKDVKEITLLVSSGPNYDKTFILQSMVGLNIDDAITIINSNFMNNVEINYEFNNSTEKNIIISQNISGEIKRNDNLKLTVSLGNKEQLEPVDMINLKGMSLFEAELWLKRNGINYKIEYEFSNDIKRNYCISQSEKEGTTINQNEMNITIIVSKGKEIIVPDFTAMTIDEATAWISENKLKVIFKEKYDNELAQGSIISSNSAINTKIEEGTTIELTISKGKLKMEEFEDINAFKAWANSLDLKYEADSEFNDLDAGKIISTTPKKDEYINLNDTIKVIYSKGKSTTIPNFVNKSKSESSTICSNYKLKCYYSYRYSNSVNEGYIISQSMSKNSIVSQYTGITLYVSKGKEPEQNINTCTSTETRTLIIQGTWVTGGSANATISTLKTKLAANYPKITFNFVTKDGNNPPGYIHEDSQVTNGSTIKDCNTYTIIINN